MHQLLIYHKYRKNTYQSVQNPHFIHYFATESQSLSCHQRRPSLAYIYSIPTKLSHISTYPKSSSLQSLFVIPLIAIRFESLYPSIMLPNTGRIPDRMICPTLASFFFFSSFLYLSTIAVVPSLSALFVPTCTRMVPPFTLSMIFSTLSVTCSILAPGKHTTTSSPLFNLVSVFLTMESPTYVVTFLLIPSSIETTNVAWVLEKPRSSACGVAIMNIST